MRAWSSAAVAELGKTAPKRENYDVVETYFGGIN